MVSKYSLLFDVKFQSMFSLHQKKASEVISSSLIQEKPSELLIKSKLLEQGAITPRKV